MLVTPPMTDSVGVAYFTLVCVEEDNDHMHSGTPCNCHGTSTVQLR